MGIEIDKDEWDRSSNISPGTEFMEKLSNKLKEGMKNKIFMDHNKSMKMILSDGNVPGEGEHKFLSIIRNMRKLKSKVDASIYIYSKDAETTDKRVIPTNEWRNIPYIPTVEERTRYQQQRYQNMTPSLSHSLSVYSESDILLLYLY